MQIDDTILYGAGGALATVVAVLWGFVSAAVAELRKQLADAISRIRELEAARLADAAKFSDRLMGMMREQILAAQSLERAFVRQAARLGRIRCYREIRQAARRETDRAQPSDITMADTDKLFRPHDAIKHDQGCDNHA